MEGARETTWEKQVGWIRKKVSVGKGGDFFNGQWCFPWLVVQIVVSKWWRRSDWKDGRTEIKLALTPRVTLASNSWIYAGLGIDWLEITLNLGFPTAYYRDSFIEERK